MRKLSRQRTQHFSVQNEGSIFLLRPLTHAARLWIAENLSPDRLVLGDAVIVERGFISEPLEGILADVLEVS